MAYVKELGHDPGASYEMTSSDTAQGLAVDKLIVNRIEMKSAEIIVEDAPIRVAGGSATPVAAGGLGKRVEIGGKVTLQSPSDCSGFRFISEEAGNHGTLQIDQKY